MRKGRAACLGWAVVLGVLLAGGAAPGELLAQAVEERTQVNQEGVQAQQKIDQLSDETESLLSEYRSTLRQIESLRVYNRQMQELIDAQEEEMASLQAQIDKVELVGRGITPLMFRMLAALEQFVDLDVPFLDKERDKRVVDLRAMIDRSDVSESEKYRRIMEAYQIENEYGRTIEAYRGSLERDGKELTVDFLRVGRIALVYLTLDGNEVGAWDQANRQWVQLDPSFRTPIKQGLRVARKQAAPDMIRLPLPAATSSGGEV